VHFNRLVVEQCWLIPPLANRVKCGLHKRRIPLNDRYLFHAAIDTDHDMQKDRPLSMSGDRLLRVSRLDLVDELGSLYITTDANTKGRSRAKRLLDARIQITKAAIDINKVPDRGAIFLVWTAAAYEVEGDWLCHRLDEGVYHSGCRTRFLQHTHVHIRTTGFY